MNDWAEHKKVCKEMVTTTVSKSLMDPAMPKKDALKVTEEEIVEKEMDSIKPVVVEREYAERCETGAGGTGGEETEEEVSLQTVNGEGNELISVCSERMEGDKREDILNGMPMHYSCHRVNYDCELP